jgi:hypothetical protein
MLARPIAAGLPIDPVYVPNTTKFFRKCILKGVANSQFKKEFK